MNLFRSNSLDIIKRGEPPEDRPFQAVCGNCGAVVQFRKHEIEVNNSTSAPSISVTCPSCNKPLCYGK